MKQVKENKNNTVKKELKPFIAPGSLIPVTQEELEKRKRRISRAEALGLSITRVTSEINSDEEYENPYTVEAMRFILNDMDVPEELKQKIQEFDRQHMERLAKEEKAAHRKANK